jgi:hypothetical protein
VDIESIQKRVQDGNYLVKSHAIIHALKEGFERQHIVEAVLDGKIVEKYPDDERVLICGKARLAEDVSIYLHIVCEHADLVYIEFVTAYIPDELEWEKPPYKRRKK